MFGIVARIPTLPKIQSPSPNFAPRRIGPHLGNILGLIGVFSILAIHPTCPNIIFGMLGIIARIPLIPTIQSPSQNAATRQIGPHLG